MVIMDFMLQPAPLSLYETTAETRDSSAVSSADLPFRLQLHIQFWYQNSYNWDLVAAARNDRTRARNTLAVSRYYGLVILYVR